MCADQSNSECCRCRHVESAYFLVRLTDIWPQNPFYSALLIYQGKILLCFMKKYGSHYFLNLHNFPLNT